MSDNIRRLVRISDQGAHAASMGHPARAGNGAFRVAMRGHPVKLLKKR